MANARLYVNNFTTTINGAINNSVTSIVVHSTTGLPALSGGDYFYLTLALGTTVEIVKVTAWSVLTLTVVRAQESTSATSWVGGSVISLNATANSFALKADLASPTFTGTVTLPSGQALIAPALGTVASGVISACTSTSMVMVTPVLGTPTSGNLSNCTALPVGSITGLGTGVGTALAANVTGSGGIALATSPTFVTPVLGTPSSGTLTSCTGLPISGIASLGTGVATVLAASVSGSTALACTTSPVFVTPTLGAASATSISFSSTSGIIGTTTNDAAAAGSVGETISATRTSASPTSLTTATAIDVQSISLTAGDWEISGNVGWVSAAANVTTLICWASLTSATLPNQEISNGVDYGATGLTVSGRPGSSIPKLRVSLSGTTTVYLSTYTAFSVGTLTACGQISARRVR